MRTLHAGFNSLFRRRLWFCLDVGHYKLLGYRAAPACRDAELTSVTPASLDAVILRPTVNIDLLLGSISINPSEKHQFTLA